MVFPAKKLAVSQPLSREQSLLHAKWLPPVFLRSCCSASMPPLAQDFDSIELPGTFPFCSKPRVTPSARCRKGERGCFPETPCGRCLEMSLEHRGSLGQQKASSWGVSRLFLARQGVSKYGQCTAARAANFSQSSRFPCQTSGILYHLPF